MAPILQARSLVKSYGVAPALRGVSLAVDEGEVVAITGPSGSGKATLRHCLAAAAGLVVAAGEAIVERRRSLAALSAAGVSRATWRRAVLAQPMLPVVPGISLAVGCGPHRWRSSAHRALAPLGVPFARLAAIAAIAIAVRLAASVATLPLLRTAAAAAELRYE